MKSSAGGLAASHRRITSFSGLGRSATLSRQLSGLPMISRKQSERKCHVVYALFEKFTERSIKSVMLAQEWARNNGELEVRKIKNATVILKIETTTGN